MQINNIYNDSSYIEQVNSYSQIRNISPVNEHAKQQSDKNSFEASSQDQKNTFVSEKIGTSIPSYDLRLKLNTPLARAYNATELFERTLRFYKKETLAKKSNTSFNTRNEKTGIDFSQSSMGKGFYIISDFHKNYSSNTSSIKNYLSEKVKHAYQQEQLREPGTLLNIIA